MVNNTAKKAIANVFNEMADMLENGNIKKNISIALTAIGSEHSEDTLYNAAKQAADQGIQVSLIGSKDISYPGIKIYKVDTPEHAHRCLEDLLKNEEVNGGVTMHYSFPIGVSTVGRVVTPSTGKEMFISTTTGTSALNRIEAMVKNALFGIIVAKACGIKKPTVGILNVDGAKQAEIALQRLKNKGYEIEFAKSARSDGGAIMRGNDLLMASCDVMVTDSLTGNILMKMFSAYTTGGNYESSGYGYGPGIGENFNELVMIVSRASGEPVVKNAILYAAQLIDGGYKDIFKQEIASAKKAGLEQILTDLEKSKSATKKADEVNVPPKEVVTEEIMGIEILDLEDAVMLLWSKGIYAESGMGCTGPVLLVSETSLKSACQLLTQGGYIG